MGRVETPKEKDRSPQSIFSWPNVETQEKTGASEAELNLQAQSRLRELGYISTETASKRWRILTEEAIPELGLPAVVNMIAWYCRFYRNNRNF